MSHTCAHKACHTDEWVTPHVWTSQVKHTKETTTNSMSFQKRRSGGLEMNRWCWYLSTKNFEVQMISLGCFQQIWLCENELWESVNNRLLLDSQEKKKETFYSSLLACDSFILPSLHTHTHTHTYNESLHTHTHTHNESQWGQCEWVLRW